MFRLKKIERRTLLKTLSLIPFTNIGKNIKYSEKITKNISHPNKNKKGRVLLFAADGLVPSFIERFREDIPNLSKIISEGYMGKVLPFLSTWENLNFMRMVTGTPYGSHFINIPIIIK